MRTFSVFRGAPALFACLASFAAMSGTNAAQKPAYQLTVDVVGRPPPLRLYDALPGISINNEGRVAYYIDRPGTWLQTQNGEGAGREAPCSDNCAYGTSINDAGTVATAGTPDTTGVPLIATVNADLAVTEIAQGPDVDLTVSINDQGAVVFSRLCEETGGVFVSQGGRLTRISTGGAPYAQPVINNHGTVAFFKYSPQGSSIVTGNGGPLTTIAHDRTDAFPAFVFGLGTLAFNDKGTVAFISQLRDGKTGVVQAKQGSFQTIADTSGGYVSFSRVALNNQGQVVFQANAFSPTRAAGVPGIFTGPDPVRDKVLAVGDPFNGSRVTVIDFWRDGLNDAGQIEFYVELEDRSQAYVRANPTSGKSKDEDAHKGDGSYLRMPL